MKQALLVIDVQNDYFKMAKWNWLGQIKRLIK